MNLSRAQLCVFYHRGHTAGTRALTVMLDTISLPALRELVERALGLDPGSHTKLIIQYSDALGMAHRLKSHGQLRAWVIIHPASSQPYLILSYSIPSHPFPSHPIPSLPFPSHPILPKPTPSRHIPSHPIPFHPTPSHRFLHLITVERSMGMPPSRAARV